MSINFPLLLVLGTCITGVIAALDMLFFARHRKAGKKAVIFEYARSFFPILLIVLVVRSFLFEPFRIPSGSLEPTLLVGDFILVNKFDYGLRWPVLNDKFFSIGAPQKGDIVVFHWPVNTHYDFIKRVVGVPGDRISYINKVLYVNGKIVSQKSVNEIVKQDAMGGFIKVQVKEEQLAGIKHLIQIYPDVVPHDFKNVLVPANSYFVMGDNRDDSEDSRYWGFVPDHNLVGKALLVWLSFDSNKFGLRWSRMGSMIH